MPTPETRPIVELTFEGCVQDAEEYGSGREQMVSRVFFWIKRDGVPPGDFHEDLASAAGDYFSRSRIEPPTAYTGPIFFADIRQPVGDDFMSGRIAVGRPEGYVGLFNQEAFAREAIAYFRAVTSDSGAMIRAEEGRPLKGSLRATRHVRLRDNVEATRRTVRFQAAPRTTR